MPTPSPCQIIRLGTVEYHRAWKLQVELAAKVHDGAQPNTLLLLEHSPVYTKGRLSKPEHILLSDEELRQKGIGVYEADRVGHQLVDLREWGGPVKYVRTLERIIVDSLADFKITAETIDGITGVWVDGAKIAAIGVKISRGVAYHGFAINVTTDLSYYSHIVPCGIADRPVTSMAEVLGEDVDMGMAQYSLAYQFGKGMGFRMVEAELEPIQI